MKNDEFQSLLSKLHAFDIEMDLSTSTPEDHKALLSLIQEASYYRGILAQVFKQLNSVENQKRPTEATVDHIKHALSVK